jgi:hypothetical protein
LGQLLIVLIDLFRRIITHSQYFGNLFFGLSVCSIVEHAQSGGHAEGREKEVVVVLLRNGLKKVDGKGVVLR